MFVFIIDLKKILFVGGLCSLLANCKGVVPKMVKNK